MRTKIKANDLKIYTNEVIHPVEFERLYKSEEILTNFKTRVNNTQKRAFATFLAEDRKKALIKEGNLIILRAIKDCREFEFISKLGKWGKFHILKEIINILNIKNHEIIKFKVIKAPESNNACQKLAQIDLLNLKKEASIILRNEDFISIIRKGAIPVTLPRFIEITPDIIELFFLIHGDRHYNAKLFFVNKEVELIRFVMDKFDEILRIPKEVWRARLLFNNSASSNLAKKRWKTLLKLKDNQFYPLISRSVLKTSKFGNLRIVIDKTVVAEIFRYIFRSIQKNITCENAIYALNGLLCAEGSAEKSKKGIHKITISFSQKEKEMFKEILIKSGIKNLKDRKDRFVIEGWLNCYNFLRVFYQNKEIPFNLHTARSNSLLSGFLEHSFTKSMNKYLSMLNETGSMNTNELIDKTNHLGNSVRKILRKTRYLLFVNSTDRGINRNPIIFSITPEGKEFLMLIKSIKEVYNARCKS